MRITVELDGQIAEDFVQFTNDTGLDPDEGATILINRALLIRDTHRNMVSGTVTGTLVQTDTIQGGLVLGRE